MKTIQELEYALSEVLSVAQGCDVYGADLAAAIDELARLRAENQRLTAELRGPGGFIEYQELTGEILRSALEGLPEAEADLPHPRPANRAAAAIARLTAEFEQYRKDHDAAQRDAIEVAATYEKRATAAESALPALRERCAEIAEHERGLYLANAQQCDRSGNATGGSLDAAGALACERVAAAIRAIPIEVKTNG